MFLRVTLGLLAYICWACALPLTTSNQVAELRSAVKNNPHSTEASEQLRIYAQQLINDGQQRAAIPELEFIRDNSNRYSLEVVYLQGICYVYLGDVDKGASFYQEVLSHDPHHSSSRINLAALHHQYGSKQEAIKEYMNGIRYLEDYVYSEQRANGFRFTEGTPAMLAHEAMLRLNLGAAYMQLGLYSVAYTQLVALLSDLYEVEAAKCGDGAQSSAGISLSGFSPEHDGQAELDAGFNKISDRGDAKSKGTRLVIDMKKMAISCAQARTEIGTTASHILNIQRATCSWHRREILDGYLLAASLERIRLAQPFDQILLPFDSLLTPYITRMESLELALAYSTRLETSNHAPVLRPDAHLRLGFLSYDFNNHPTAHLAEAIFSLIHAKQQSFQDKRECSEGAGDCSRHTDTADAAFDRVRTYVYSYGLDDSSDYRKNIIRTAGSFRDLVLSSYQESYETIANDKVDILLDMQVHTLGSRIRIPSSRPAPIQVSYLVYPGTSGTAFLDCLVADKMVVPPEHAVDYTESLLLLPPSYQISYYERHDSHELREILNQFSVAMAQSSVKAQMNGVSELKKRLRKANGLPAEVSAVFCNFNKVDKIDLVSTLTAWMNILRNVPGSVLWILEPGIRADPADPDRGDQDELVRSQIREACQSAGISTQRVFFAPRVSKSIHLARQLAADVFLDSFIYGAHSTATDALRGGLPVLTVGGGAFPSRVLLSLYASLEGNSLHAHTTAADNQFASFLMVRHSIRDFENFAVDLVRNRPRMLHRLTMQLIRAVQLKLGIFNYEKQTRSLLRGMEALKETRALQLQVSRIDPVQPRSRKPSVFMTGEE